MSSPNAALSDLEDNNSQNKEGYASDEAIEDVNYREEDENAKTKTKAKATGDTPATPAPKQIKNPRPKLDAERLKSAKGIHAIEEHFEDFKFRGKGNEKEDLDKMMKKLEYWSHRLFPKFEFDDCLAKLETLGTKKAVQTHLKRIRLGMWTKDDIEGNAEDILDGDLIDDEVPRREDSAPIDEFDALIAEQLEKQRQASVTPQRAANASTSSSFSSIAFGETPRQTTLEAISSSVPSQSMEITEEMKERIERNRQSAIQKKLTANSLSASQPLPSTSKPSEAVEITEEMRERMERNRQLAIQKRLAKIEAEQARKNSIENTNQRDRSMPDTEEKKNQEETTPSDADAEKNQDEEMPLLNHEINEEEIMPEQSIITTD